MRSGFYFRHKEKIWLGLVGVHKEMKKLKYNFYGKLLHFPYLPKWIILFLDLLIVELAFFVTCVFFYLIGRATITPAFLAINLGICLIVNLLFFLLFKTYTGIIRFSTFRDTLRIFQALLCANVSLFIVSIVFERFYSLSILPVSGFLLNFLYAFGTCFFFRMIVKLTYEYARKNTIRNKRTPILVYGTNAQLIEFANVLNGGDNYKVVGFISNEERLINKEILGLPVYSVAEVKKHAPENKIFKAILIAPKEMDRLDKQEISDLCIQNNIELLSAPDWIHLKKTNSKTSATTQLQKIHIEDLLGRIPIAIDTESIGQNLKGKTVMVTGAAGSIGSEIVRQISRFETTSIVLCDIAETPLHELSLEVNSSFPEATYHCEICNVRDYNQMTFVMAKYKPDYIYHAAAYKHVPLMEEHPYEAVLTNVLGSKNVIDLAIQNDVEVFVMISTDKAVNPSNVMGASKRIAEIYVQSRYHQLKKSKARPTRVITTRFGNVLGSNGSVIPRFKQQIEKGGPITVTHENIIRYFMTIPEASRLVLEASNFGKGGEVFLFDMGDSVKIKDMAEKMIRLAGLEPYKDIDIIYTGLRPGEKLYEELLYDKEKVKPTHNKKILIGTVREYDPDEISDKIDNLINVTRSYDKNQIVKTMKEIVPEFISQNSVYTFLDQEGDAEL